MREGRVEYHTGHLPQVTLYIYTPKVTYIRIETD